MRGLAALCLLAACGPAAPPAPKKVHTTYRAMGGLSMGAIGTAAIGLTHHARFDALAALGAPLDAALLLRTVDGFHTGGFCPRAEVQAKLATLNDPATAGCISHPPPLAYEHVQNFNRWVYTVNTPFDRTGYVGLFTDLTLAFGNLLTENPMSTFAPPGVDEALARKPPATACTSPVRVRGMKNREYNPDGAVDAITFCDGEPTPFFCNTNEELVDFCSDRANITSPLPVAMEAAFAAAFCAAKGGASIANRIDHPAIMLRAGGRFDPCRQQREAVLVALAWDFNGNGRRDYGEPVVNNSEERYRDTGKDGCANALEDGAGGCRSTMDPAAIDPNGDDYDAAKNPLGTENDWRREAGEPYADDGLDGVPGSGDFGEGNGAFDMTNGRKRLYAHDARSALAGLSSPQLERINLLLDGGIRDLFNFGLMSHQVWGLLNALKPDGAPTFREWTEIPGMKDSRTGAYRPWGGPWKRAPKSFEVLFGKETPTLEDRLLGDGDHVGTNSQAVYRIATLYNWVASQWPSLERPVTFKPGVQDTPYDQREKVESFQSAALGAKRGYGVFIPPGYDFEENAAVRYPVLYLLHGYTGTPRQILPSAFLADTFMKDSDVQLRPMIVVVPSGACCFVQKGTGARDCREEDDARVAFLGRTDWERECVGGSFFVSQVGASKYQESMLELMDEIDAKYRTLPAADVTER